MLLYKIIFELEFSMNNIRNNPDKSRLRPEKPRPQGKEKVSRNTVQHDIGKINLQTNRQVLWETGLIADPPWWNSQDPLVLVWGQLNSAVWLIESANFIFMPSNC
jgi:hypothetical protein